MTAASGADTRASASRGFTLIEILVALLVFVTGVTGLLALLTTALAMHRDGLTLSRVTRDLDAVVAQVRREVAAGQHHDAEHDAFADVAATSLPDGTTYSVHFLPPRGDQPLLAELRVAGSSKELARSRPVTFAVPEGPPRSAEVLRYRTRGGGSSRDGTGDH